MQTNTPDSNKDHAKDSGTNGTASQTPEGEGLGKCEFPNCTLLDPCTTVKVVEIEDGEITEVARLSGGEST